MKLSYSDVFKPGTYPEHTYVTRYSPGTKYTYEQRLQQCLDLDGFLTTIVGPSKSGKTVLCEKVIGLQNIISLSGNDFKKEDDFWNVVAKKVGISMSGEFTQLSGNQYNNENKANTSTEMYVGNKDKVVTFFTKNNKVLILDDFHYAPKEVQYNIACQLKDVIRNGFKTIVISLPHRSDDTIRLNPDLVGRISLIEIDTWKEDELTEIAVRGFEQLDKEITDKIAKRISVESIHSPLLMQSVCLNIKYIQKDDEKITDTSIDDSCRFTCLNYPYNSVVNMLKAGPPSRGQQRIKYDMTNGGKLDIYSIILKTLAENPPYTCLNFDEIKTRIGKIVMNSATKISNKKVQDALKNLQKLINESEAISQVFEWKDSSLFILDPLFLFYLRWKNE